MKKKDMAKLASHKTALQVLDDYAIHWNTIAPIREEVEQFWAIVRGIDADLATQTDAAPEGFTRQKNQAFAEMCTEAYNIALKLKAWAVKQHNEVVLKAVSYRPYQLQLDTETEQLSRCRLILSKGQEDRDAMVEYKLTTTQLEALQASIQKAAALSITRNVVGANRQTATGNIAGKMKMAAAIVGQLDDLVEGLTEPEDADFVSGWFAARKTVYHRGRTAKKPSNSKRKSEDKV